MIGLETLKTFLDTAEVMTGGLKLYFAAATFAFFLFYLFAALYRDGRDATGLEGKRMYILLAVIAVAVALRFVIYPHHAILVNDDFYHMQDARAIVEPAFEPINKFQKSIGWPFLISLFYWPAGPHEDIVFYLNSFIGVISVVAIFALVYSLTMSKTAALAGAALLAVHPLHCMWSICGENNVVSIFFMITALAGFICFVRYNHPEFIWLSLFSVSYAAQTRVEHLLLFPVLAVGLRVIAPALSDFKRLAMTMIGPVLLTIPNLIYEADLKLSTDWTASDTAGAAAGSNFSITNLAENLKGEYERIASGHSYSLILFILVAFAVLLAWRKRAELIVFFLATGALYVGLISFLWQTLAHRNRFFLYFDVCLIVVACMGIKALQENRKLRVYSVYAALASVAAACVFSLNFHMVNISPMYYYPFLGRNITLSIKKMREILPPDARVVLADPAPVQAVTDFEALTPEAAVVRYNELDDSTLFLYIGAGARPFPDAFFHFFNSEKIFAVQVNPDVPADEFDYGLYRLKKILPDPE